MSTRTVPSILVHLRRQPTDPRFAELQEEVAALSTSNQALRDQLARLRAELEEEKRTVRTLPTWSAGLFAVLQ